MPSFAARFASRSILPLLMFVLSLAGSSHHVIAAVCTEQSASEALRFEPGDNGWDSGVVPSGFVKPSDNTPIVSGIDASKYQHNANFDQVQPCGGDFAYIRISAGTLKKNEEYGRALWANAVSNHLLTGPYHHLTLVDSEKALSALLKPELDQLIAANRAHATKQVALFIDRLRELLDLDPIDEQAPGYLGRPYLPVALDVTERPQAGFTENDRRLYGAAYGTAVCQWIKDFQAAPIVRNQPVILFTKPEIYRDYAFASAPCDLSRLKVWVSYHGRTGDRAMSEKTDPGLQASIKALCLDPNGQDRCIFEQYTSFGKFAVHDLDAGVDLDRYFGALDSLKSLRQRANDVPKN